ncbi:MAG: hypothetical protein GY913_32655 [Proteobacteria bacterium]|nr:hypothetical protein [Pseudomonadota bacterium]MCP4921674.1 hypothetical protein [Pseudomonadota bacterium]
MTIQKRKHTRTPQQEHRMAARTSVGNDLQDLYGNSFVAENVQDPSSSPMAEHIRGGGELIPGAQGAAVLELQRMMGMPTDELDGIFGPTTKAWLMHQQGQNGVGQTGRVGATTLVALGGTLGDTGPAQATETETPSAGGESSTVETRGAGQTGQADAASALDVELGRVGVIHEGFNGGAVTEIQQLLGMQDGGLTGEFGPTTKKRLLEFQRRHGVQQTGKVGPTTLDFLRRANSPNGILFDHKTGGASRTTAQGNGVGGHGVSASEAMADQDRQRLLGMRDQFSAVGDRHGLPPALLAAIASRETRGGTQLDRDGYSRWDGQGFGVMQVDKRHHAPAGGAKSEAHIEQAGTILSGYLGQVKKDFPDWTESRQLQAAVFAYHRGPGSVRAGSMDHNSAGGDYSSDTWARARHLAGDFGGTETTVRVEPDSAAPTGATSPDQDAEQAADPASKDERSSADGAAEKDDGQGSAKTANLAAAIDGGETFRQGATGPQVLEIQRLLGFGPKGQTAEIGPYTKTKIAEFQAARGLPADGVVGPKTYEALVRASQLPDVSVIDQHAMNSRNAGGYCGVATVLSTLQGLGKDPGVDVQNRTELDAFASQMYIQGKGSSGNKMAMVLRDQGETGAEMTYGGGVSTIMDTLKKGKPVPVGFVSMGGDITADARSARYGQLHEGDRHYKKFGEAGHWATVVGFEGDPKNPSHFIVNDSDTGAQIRMTRSELERHTKANQGIWMVQGM